MDFLESSYFLIAAIAFVVLLIILFILIRVRARRATTAAAKTPTKVGATPQAPRAVRDTRKPAAKAARQEQTDLVHALSHPAPGEPDLTAPPSPTPPSDAGGPTSDLRSPARPKPLSAVPTLRPLSAGIDPVLNAVTAIAAGTGPLTAKEMRRLDLYRTERILQAVEQLRAEIVAGKPPNLAALERLKAVMEYATRPSERSAEATPPPTATEAGDRAATAPTSPAASLGGEQPPAAEEPVAQEEPTEEAAEVAPLESETSEFEPVTVSPETVREEEAVPEIMEEIPEAIAEIPLAAEAAEPETPMTPIAATLLADDLLLMPEDQREANLSQLPLAELERIVETTDDRILKMKVIDRLQAMGGPDALLVLDACLRDPDPEVQVYALNAAERLLGKRA